MLSVLLCFRWLQSIDCQPGINSQIIDYLCQKKAERPEQYTHCAFMLDAMSIRQQISYNAHTGRMCGFVDLGNNEDTDDEAKEVLVFMLVGLQGHWKVPVAYFFTNTLTALTQKELVVHVLEELESKGFRVIALTMDAHASNVSMCQLLGCCFEVNGSFQSWFVLPNSSHKVCVIFDPCHMIKLFRNLLASYNTVISDSGRISWSYIKDLHSLQEDSGLRAANKLSSKHICFSNQKMKVSLAVQTFSSSVAKALRTVRDIGYMQFKDVDATAELLEMIDHLFDIMNSRNPHAKGYKAPLRLQNVRQVSEFLVKCRDKLLQLKCLDKKFLYESKRHAAKYGC